MIEKITLLNFRRFSKQSFNIKSQFVIVTGDNATGKTTLLEAVYAASVTKSLRTSNLQELVKENEDFNLVEIDANNKKFKFGLNNKVKTVSINNNEIKKMSDYIGNLPAVFFTPSELALITGAPLTRRLFLNIELSQLYPKYVNHLSVYNNILKERNALLKSVKINKTYLNLVTENLCIESLHIMKYRNAFISEINSVINSIHKMFTDEEVVRIDYVPSLPADNTLSFMNEKVAKDLQTQTTNYGIHRDDLIFKINDKDARIYASQGQKRTLVLSLKIALVLLIQKQTQEFPILLLDDVLSELDVKRQNNLLSIILNLGQTFISVTNVGLNDLEVLKNYQVIKLERELN